jgi:predicted transcriptional regulator
MIDRKQLRSMIPHGYVNQIADRVGVSYQSVSQYFAGKLNSEKIENAALEIAAEVKEKKESLIKRVHG